MDDWSLAITFVLAAIVLAFGIDLAASGVTGH
jgi:hypothetical protein